MMGERLNGIPEDRRRLAQSAPLAALWPTQVTDE